MADSRLQEIESYLKPSNGAIVLWSLISLFIFFALLISGSELAPLIGVMIGTPILGLWINYWIKCARSAGQPTEPPARYAARYGTDVLCDDFSRAHSGMYGDDFRLGQHFLYSRHASRILAYSEIISVTTSFHYNGDNDDYYLDCNLKNGATVTISDCKHNFDYRFEIESHIKEAQKNPIAPQVQVASWPSDRHSLCSSEAPASTRTYTPEELEMLRALHQEGTITDEEYQQCIAGQENQ